MKHFDVFNGDADGICALVQLRLAEPKDSTLITGVKRDISLLKQVPVSEPVAITVLDISLDKNRTALDEQLKIGSDLTYIDHHFPGDNLPESNKLEMIIDTDSHVCTSLLVDKKLDGKYRNWAITAAFGDNLNAVAEQLAEQSGLTQEQTEQLKKLGICINYNGYGRTVNDLHFAPADLYLQLVHYADPLDFVAAPNSCWQQLFNGYTEDMEQGHQQPPMMDEEHMLIVALPDQPWSYRVNGVLGNDLANANPDKGIAILTHADSDHFAISVRAPLNNRTGADELVRQFPTGGGRKAAAGINQLPKTMIDEFIDAMRAQWSMS